MRIFIDNVGYLMETNYYDFSVKYKVPIQLLRMLPISSCYGDIRTFTNNDGTPSIGLYLGKYGYYYNKCLLACPATYININSKGEKFINCIYSAVDSWHSELTGKNKIEVKYHKRLKIYEAKYAGYYCLVEGNRCYGPNSALREKPTILIPIRREN